TERSIVTDEAGTTRDAIHTRYKLYGKDFILVDTAGIRKKSKVRDDIEFYSVLRALNALEDCDVCIVIIDAERGLESQDVNIISLAHRQGKGIVLMVNKWDLIEKDSKTSDRYTKDILEKLSPIDYIPVIFASALSKQRIFQVIEKAVAAYECKNKKIPTSVLNEKILPEIEHYPPPCSIGKHINITYLTQVQARFPSIVFFCNLPQYIQTSYEHLLENKLHKHFHFEGVPI